MALTQVQTRLIEATGTPSATTFLRGDGTWSTAGGGAIDNIFYENNQTVTADYTIVATKNAMSAGPVTVASGVTVTVESGGDWTIV